MADQDLMGSLQSMLGMPSAGTQPMDPSMGNSSPGYGRQLPTGGDQFTNLMGGPPGQLADPSRGFTFPGFEQWAQQGGFNPNTTDQNKLMQLRQTWLGEQDKAKQNYMQNWQRFNQPMRPGMGTR